MQTTLLGLAIAFIVALVAALIGPYFVDWNQFRPQFEAEATQVIGAPVRVAGDLQARLLPSPSLRLGSVVVGGANDLGKVRADKLDVEFSLGSLMRGEWRATELTIGGMALDLGLDPKGRIDWPSGNGKFNLGSLSIDRLNLTGRAALHDAASRKTLELNDIAFSGDVRSLAGSLRGDGSFALSGQRIPFRVSSGQSADGSGTRLHLNIDPGARSLSAELDGIVSFETRAPRFDGTITLGAAGTRTGTAAKTGAQPATMPWRVSAKVKADHEAAKLDQIELNYGGEDSPLKLTGTGDFRFGISPLLHAALSARQLDADRFAVREGGAKDNIKDSVMAEPTPVMPTLRALIAAGPQLPVPAQFELSAEQITLGGRALQNFAADLHTDTKSWTVDRLDVRAPGATHLSLNGSSAASGHFRGALSVDSSDPDALVTWLQGRSESSWHSQKPLRLNGEVNVAANGFAIDPIKCEIDGGTVEGRIALSHDASNNAALEANLKAERLDLDSAGALARALLGPQSEWPARARLALDVDHAISAGQELHPFITKFSYDPNSFSLDALKIGQANGLTLEGQGAFDRANMTGKLVLDSSAPSLSQITGPVAPWWPQLAPRLDAMKLGPGPARLKLALGIDRDSGNADRSNAHATLDLDASQFKGSATFAARSQTADLRGLDLDKIRRSEISIESRLSSEQGASLLALLGLDGAIAAKDGPAQFQGSVTGVWGAPFRVKVNLTGAGLDAEAQGTAELAATDAKSIKADLALKARSLNLDPLFDLRPSDRLAQDVGLSSHLALADGKLTLDDIDGGMAGSRLRGRVALTFDRERRIDGDLGLDTLDLAPAFTLMIGAGGRDATEPLGTGPLQGARGQIAFQALRGVLPGGTELRPVSAVVKSDGHSLTFDAIKAGIGGGEASGTIETRQSPGGLALNARVALNGVEGSALHYRALTMPAGSTSLQMTLTSQGRSASALTGALAGSGTVTLESARISGLDPYAFDVAMRASDSGQVADDARLRKIVEPALAGGALLVASAQIPFTIRDGHLRVGATALQAEGARAIVSGGYDISAGQADIRATLAPVGSGPALPPEIQLFATGSPNALDRSVDVASLSSWLAVRAIDRETRRLDSMERGEAVPASIPPVMPRVVAPNAVPSAQPPAARPPFAVPAPAKLPPRPKPSAPPQAAAPRAGNASVASQQAPPLPAPIDVRPPPGPAPRAPRPKPPLVLTPPPSTF